MFILFYLFIYSNVYLINLINFYLFDLTLFNFLVFCTCFWSCFYLFILSTSVLLFFSFYSTADAQISQLPQSRYNSLIVHTRFIFWLHYTFTVLTIYTMRTAFLSFFHTSYGHWYVFVLLLLYYLSIVLKKFLLAFYCLFQFVVNVTCSPCGLARTKHVSWTMTLPF